MNMKMYFIFNLENSLHASSQALTTTRMEFEALEDDVNAIHGDLWEQLNAGGQVCAFHICHHQRRSCCQHHH